MSYIHRDIETKIVALSQEYACVMVVGPRQVGKSTVLEHLAHSARNRVTLDDLQERSLAKRDPAMFLQLHPAPLMIDEVQYAPELFSYLKIAIDNGVPAGSYWLTGSKAFDLMDLAQESLAGRVAIVQMTALSQHEIFGSGPLERFTPALASLQQRATTHAPANLNQLYERIFNGGMPGHISKKFTDREVFYASYLATYIGRDDAEEIPRVDQAQFHDFIRAAACRVGQVLNVHSIASDVGVADATAKAWLGVLEKAGVVFYLRPFSNNLLTRTVKVPKLYFFDTGLVAYLTRYSSAEILANGALAGAILENFVVAEMRKGWLNSASEAPLWYYRDCDGREIDLVLEADGCLYPLEVKRSVNPGAQVTRAFKALDRSGLQRGCGTIVCMREELGAQDANTLIVPAWMI